MRTNYLTALLFFANLFCGVFMSISHVKAANVISFPNLSMLDITAPGISSNVQERVCVFNLSNDSSIDVSEVQSTVVGWLNESDGWQIIGGSKVNFIADCSDPNVRIEFHDPESQSWPCPENSAACAPQRSGSVVRVYDAPYHSVTAIAIAAPFWTCIDVPPGTSCYASDDLKKRLINHEMGHMVGLDHFGPVIGITSSLGQATIYQDAPEGKPVTHEIYQSRAQLNGLASPALHACIGFPSSSQVLVSWFDTARGIASDSENRAALYKNEGGWQLTDVQTVGAFPDIGSRVDFLFDVGAVGVNSWSARADVIGGPRDEVNWDPALFTQTDSMSVGAPNTPCTVDISSTGNGDVAISWSDASYNETEWHLYYALANSDWSIDSWQYRGACLGADIEGCGDSTSFTQMFSVGDRLCVRIAAGNSNGISNYSNIACAEVY